MVTACFLRTAAATLAALALTACSSLGPDESAAGDAALAFYAAYGDEDGARACALMTESARTELEQSTDEPCDSAIVSEDLPSADQVEEVEAYGRNARVILDGDVVFLSVADGTWRISAAGCEYRSNAAYDCTITGG